MMKYHQENLLLFLLTSMHHHQSLQMKFGATFTLANSQKYNGLTSDDITDSSISSSISDGIINSASANSINSQNLNMHTIFANQLIQHLNEKLQIAGLYNNNNNNSINLNNNINNNNNNSGVVGIINPIFHHELMKNQIILNGSEFADETWRKQMEYDKFMNEIWIGVVLTLIIISLVFCVCSCFLYHQFRQWQINYRHNIERHNHDDIESVKLNLEDDDPVPQYTLVSGLPSYETALDMLQKSTNQKSCIIVYPSVFNIFTKNEKDDIITTTISSLPLSPIDATSTTIPTDYNRKNSIEKSRNSLTIIIPKYDQNDNENSERDEDTNSNSNYSEALLDNTNFHKNP